MAYLLKDGFSPSSTKIKRSPQSGVSGSLCSTRPHFGGLHVCPCVQPPISLLGFLHGFFWELTSIFIPCNPYRLLTTLWGLRVQSEIRYKVALVPICHGPPFNPVEPALWNVRLKWETCGQTLVSLPHLLRNVVGLFRYTEPDFPR